MALGLKAGSENHIRPKDVPNDQVTSESEVNEKQLYFEWEFDITGFKQ